MTADYQSILPTSLTRRTLMDNLNTMQRCTICRTELYSPWHFETPCCIHCDLDEYEAEGERLSELKAEGDR